jgi:hypothetical protein
MGTSTLPLLEILIEILLYRKESISFALFDSQLDRLKLPVLRSPRISNASEEDAEQSPRLESVAGLVQKYFEWVAVFDKCLSLN